jgi:hypothetical protein
MKPSNFSPVQQESAAPELQHVSPTVRDALLFAIWYRKGGHSEIGQQVERLLGIGRFQRLSEKHMASINRMAGALRLHIETPLIAIYPPQPLPKKKPGPQPAYLMAILKALKASGKALSKYEVVELVKTELGDQCTTAAISNALSKACSDGDIRRVSKGIYKHSHPQPPRS